MSKDTHLPRLTSGNDAGTSACYDHSSVEFERAMSPGVAWVGFLPVSLVRRLDGCLPLAGILSSVVRRGIDAKNQFPKWLFSHYYP